MTTTCTIEIELEVDFTYEPPVPACVSGPPEDCYPAEGDEVELQSAELVLRSYVYDDRGGRKTQSVSRLDILDYLDSDCLASLEEQIRTTL